MLDTSVAIPLRDRELDTLARVEALDGSVMFSVVTLVELEGGVMREAAQAPLRRTRLDVILASVPVIAFDASAAAAYRMIVERAGYSRRKLLDRIIAAQALTQDATLVTYNAADFADVPGLDLRAW